MVLISGFAENSHPACEPKGGEFFQIVSLIHWGAERISIMLSEEELIRYQRQLIIPDIGEEGQEKLKKSHVIIAGVGGLGSISASYLVAAGVGHITLVDGDRVEPTNLNRQILHWTSDVDKWKVESAFLKLSEMNPYCRITAVHERINIHNIMDILGNCSFIIDATDNFQTRQVLNTASLRKKIPFIYGGVNKFSGMITTFVPGETPCFECVFPTMTPSEKSVGILGPVPGVIASMQAMEVLKLILGIGETLKGKLLQISLFNMKFREISIDRNPDCSMCGKKEEFA